MRRRPWSRRFSLGPTPHPISLAIVQHVEVAGLRIAYRRAGSGPSLLLLHGGLSDSREWRHQIDALTEDFDTVAWDAPGCGGSSDPPETIGLDGYADCLAAFIDELGLGRPHVAGLSFGAGVALQLYRRHPRLPRSLLLASAYAGWAGSLPAEIVASRVQQVLRQADLPPDQVVGEWLPTLFAGSVSADVVEEAAAIMRDFHPAGMRAMARAFAEADLRDVLPTIDVPTLLLYGDADQRSPRDVAEALHAAIPGSRLVWLRGVGHQSNLEAPARFNDEARAFFRSVP
jgi:pimeloyl-ACP methyl ester carboxylesterase